MRLDRLGADPESRADLVVGATVRDEPDDGVLARREPGPRLSARSDRERQAARVIAASEPGIDLANSFAAFGLRGVLLASRAVFIFAVAVIVGAVVARTLPSIIIATVIAAVGLAGGQQVHQEILQGEAVAIPIDEQNFNGGGGGHMYFDQKFVLPDGSLVGYDYFDNAGTGPYDDQGNPRYPMVSIVVPGERYRSVETREALVLAGGSLVALTLAAFVVTRLRPD